MRRTPLQKWRNCASEARLTLCEVKYDAEIELHVGDYGTVVVHSEGGSIRDIESHDSDKQDFLLVQGDSGRSFKHDFGGQSTQMWNTRATIQFDGLQFPASTARVAVVPVYDMDSDGLSGSPFLLKLLHDARICQHRYLLLLLKNPHRRISVFERLSQLEAPTTKMVVVGGRIFVVSTNTTTRRQIRNKNAELRSSATIPRTPIKPVGPRARSNHFHPEWVYMLEVGEKK
ncbi:hypothetical protein M5K25_014577 [Dendrobium thyrsiflorum]|uniref:Uncharacterized protein n=1 Tax=Dendrobium thyrsiflorum TaxID=117978 RepID=A0ABD0UNM8_DENTH